MWNTFLREGHDILQDLIQKNSSRLLLLYRMFSLIDRMNHRIIQINDAFQCCIPRIV
jgi:hypothetical protein